MEVVIKSIEIILNEGRRLLHKMQLAEEDVHPAYEELEKKHEFKITIHLKAWNSAAKLTFIHRPASIVSAQTKYNAG